MSIILCLFFFFFNDTATTEIYTLSLHDALPISQGSWFANEFDTILLVLLTGIPFPGLSLGGSTSKTDFPTPSLATRLFKPMLRRSEEHTSELQSRLHLVCRLLLEKKKKQ